MHDQFLNAAKLVDAHLRNNAFTASLSEPLVNF